VGSYALMKRSAFCKTGRETKVATQSGDVSSILATLNTQIDLYAMAFSRIEAFQHGSIVLAVVDSEDVTTHVLGVLSFRPPLRNQPRKRRHLH